MFPNFSHASNYKIYGNVFFEYEKNLRSFRFRSRSGKRNGRRSVNLQGRVNLKDVVQIKAQSEKKVEVESVSDQKVIPLKAQAPMKASVEHKSVVLYEDFNNVPDGETETIGHLGDRYTDYVASHYFEPGRYIDNEYTPAPAHGKATS